MEERKTDPNRENIFFNHPKENDEFFELNEAGRTAMNPDLQNFIRKFPTRNRKEIRVRRTTNKNTGQLKESIIKTRIADKDIYNPGCDFDYRISISLESQWNGTPDQLIPMREQNRGRQKDRMSYRHMMYQIDLTQVAYEYSSALEHELEVEIATEALRTEIAQLRGGNPSHQYPDMIKGLIDNVRLLCRHGSVHR